MQKLFLLLVLLTANIYSAEVGGAAAVSADAERKEAAAGSAQFPLIHTFLSQFDPSATDHTALAPHWTANGYPAGEMQTLCALAHPVLSRACDNPKAALFLTKVETTLGEQRDLLFRNNGKLNFTATVECLKTLIEDPSTQAFAEVMQADPEAKTLAALYKQVEDRRNAVYREHALEMCQSFSQALRAYASNNSGNEELQRKYDAQQQELEAMKAQMAAIQAMIAQQTRAAAGPARPFDYHSATVNILEEADENDPEVLRRIAFLAREEATVHTTIARRPTQAAHDAALPAASAGAGHGAGPGAAEARE